MTELRTHPVSQPHYFTYMLTRKQITHQLPHLLLKFWLLKYCSVSPVMHYIVQSMRVQKHFLPLQKECCGVKRYCSFHLSQSWNSTSPKLQKNAGCGIYFIWTCHLENGGLKPNMENHRDWKGQWWLYKHKKKKTEKLQLFSEQAKKKNLWPGKWPLSCYCVLWELQVLVLRLK